jgi:hypothetical protein
LTGRRATRRRDYGRGEERAHELEIELGVEGKVARAHSGAVGNGSGLEEGAPEPESTPRLVGTDEEDDGAGIDAGVLDSVQWHRRKWRAVAELWGITAR